MGLFRFLSGWFGGISDQPELPSNEFDSHIEPLVEPAINPANGLPMSEGTGLDIEGNPYGTDVSHSDSMFKNSLDNYVFNDDW